MVAHRGWNHRFLFGGGASVDLRTNDRLHWILDAEATIPRTDTYTSRTGPRNLPSSDTTSAVHNVNNKRWCYGLYAGVEHLLGHMPRRWHVTVRAQAGYVVDLTNWIDDHVLTYTGERRTNKGRVTVRHVELRAGPGFRIEHQRSTFGIDLFGSLAVPIEAGGTSNAALRAHIRTVGFALTYRRSLAR